MKKNQKHKRRNRQASACRRMIAAACLLFWIALHPVPVYAASATDWLRLVASTDREQSQIEALSNATLIEQNGVSYVITTADYDWAAAENCLLLDLSTNETTQVQTPWQPVGPMMYVNKTDEDLGGCQADMMDTAKDLSVSDPVVCIGIGQSSQNSGASFEYLKIETAIKGSAAADGDHTYYLLEQALPQEMAGSLILNAQGHLIGIAASYDGSTVLLPLDWFVDFSGESTKAEKGSGADTSEIRSVVSDNPILSPYFICAVLISSFAFVGGVFSYKNRELRVRTSGQEEFPQMFPESLAVTEQSGFTVVGISGYFQGQRFSLGNGAVIFGRDAAQCSALYPPKTPCISGLHCRVELSGQRVYLTDLGSSYGTYLKGQKLTPHMSAELRYGDSFYLADEKNVFQIR